MSERMPERKPKKRICVGLLAHVDAGKTTLSEAILYLSGRIRRLGRVDHRDTFLDTFSQERARGITIFSKQAVIESGDTVITLVDTPGHVDFGAETERTLQILDYAILVISGADGIQGHTYTLWKLLQRYHIPVFLFINKMDQVGTDRHELLAGIREKLSANCVDFGEDQEKQRLMEEIAVCDEKLLEEYMSRGELRMENIADAIAGRKLFPCYFGSALKLEGVEDLRNGLCRYSKAPAYAEEFGARVYKIARDSQGVRLSYLKVTGGRMTVKMTVKGRSLADDGEERSWEEKISQIRIYSGEKYEAVTEAEAGTVCAVCGLSETYPGEGLGCEAGGQAPFLEPVLTYRVCLPQGCDSRAAFFKLKRVEEELPELHLMWHGNLGEIRAQLMGEVQTEILKSLVAERCGLEISFDEGSILYKETIKNPVEGIGHYEPLRHYAEVHLLMEPGEPGSGLQFSSVCSEEVLDRNWQRLILTHLKEKEHPGVLTGSPITDMRITLLTGKASRKHTEGGDFREAVYRAVRQGLMCAESVLLEPWYQFRIEIPADQLGRAMNDIQAMSGVFSSPEINGEMAVLTGKAPVSEMRNYQAQAAAYSGGRAKVSCVLSGYEACHNAEKVIAEFQYDSEADREHPSGSVFCAHGAGFSVPWNEVRNYMHLDSGWKPETGDEPDSGTGESTGTEHRDRPVQGGLDQGGGNSHSRIYRSASFGSSAEEKELEEIFVRTYGPVKQERREQHSLPECESSAPESKKTAKRVKPEEYLLVDGYNIIFSWDELRELAADNLDGARGRLMDILSHYQGIRKCVLILVFDAYRVKGGTERVMTWHNIHVVYTREAETADQYIEKATHRIAAGHQVTVATSDGVEQLIIMGQGAVRMSAGELQEEIETAFEEVRKNYLLKPSAGKNLLVHHLDDGMKELLEEVRLGKRKL